MTNKQREMAESFEGFSKSAAGKKYLEHLVIMHETTIEELSMATDMVDIFRAQGKLMAIKHIIELPKSLIADATGGEDAS